MGAIVGRSAFKEPLNITNGGLDVNIQDQHTADIDLLLVRRLDTFTILADTSIDDTSMDIETTGVIPTTSHDRICLKEGSAFYQGEILSVVPIAGNQYTITLDSPLDFAFTAAGGTYTLTNDNLAVNGSVTPVIFRVSPAGLDAGIKWDITRMFVHIQGTAAMDDGLFGDQAALTKGVVFRTNNGIVKNLSNAKSNGDFAEHAFDRNYASKAPAGKTSVTIRRTWAGPSKSGVTKRLSASTSDEFQCIVQDDLTGVDHMHVIVQGHVVE